MKKLLVIVLLITVLSPVFAVSKFGIGTSVYTGTEIYTGTFSTIPQLSFGGDFEFPIVRIDNESSVSFPLSFTYITNFINSGRYTNLSSFRAGFGVRYIYQFKQDWQIGFGATGGFWLFNINRYIKPATVFHSIEGRVGHNLGKHFVVSLPVAITLASFGTNYNVSVAVSIK